VLTLIWEFITHRNFRYSEFGFFPVLREGHNSKSSPQRPLSSPPPREKDLRLEGSTITVGTLLARN